MAKYQVKRYDAIESVIEEQCAETFNEARRIGKQMMDNGAFSVVIMKDNVMMKAYRSAAWHIADAQRYRQMLDEDQAIREMCE